jgi:hypothetical protein
MKNPLLRLAVLSFTVFFCGAAQAVYKPLTNQKLYWKPTNEISDIAVGSLANHKFKIAAFKDARATKPKNRIGVNIEGRDKKYVDADTGDFGPFVTTHISETLTKAGMDIVQSGEKITLSGEIKDLFVEEENTYKGRAIIKYVATKGGTVVWSGVMSGSATRFGRSYKMDNYMESVSDAIMDSLAKLTADQEFKTAVK